MNLLSQKVGLIIACLIIIALGTFTYNVTRKILWLLLTVLITFILLIFIIY